MQLINVAVARSIWLLSFDELNPRGVRLNPTLAEALEDRYDFRRQKRDEKPNEPWHFQLGAFTVDGIQVNVNLQIYGDGMMAETTSSTEKSDSFLQDLLAWSAAKFGLNYHDGIVKKKFYYSELVVQAKVDFCNTCERLNQFAKKLSDTPVFGGGQSQQVTAISFGPDNPVWPSFTFERRVNTSFAEDKYYSRAALQTDSHLALLSEFEDLFAPRSA
ncbi:MAG: hypothetical protein ACRD8O_14210 [Bryobacteraceae bacterium]